ncbi:hypothetical protein G3N94_08640 [Burkholderia sp. Ac-20353]|nr:hypothetical protein [Burkholderia sp. Ac-20353]
MGEPDPATPQCEAANRSSCLPVEMTVHVVAIAVSYPDVVQGACVRSARQVSVLNHTARASKPVPVRASLADASRDTQDPHFVNQDDKSN